jgi:hypothetical protein
MARDDADTDDLRLFGSGVADDVADEFRADAPVTVWGPHGQSVQVGCFRVGLLEGHTSGEGVFSLVKEVFLASLEIGQDPILGTKRGVFGIVFPGEVEPLGDILMRFTDNCGNLFCVFCGGRDYFYVYRLHDVFSLGISRSISDHSESERRSNR